MDIKDCEQAKAGDCCYCKNMAYKKLEQCLDDIEEICKNSCYINVDTIQDDILDLIKQTKEGEE